MALFYVFSFIFWVLVATIGLTDEKNGAVPGKLKKPLSLPTETDEAHI